MNCLRPTRCLLLLFAAILSGASHAQSGTVQELESYRLQLHEQFVAGKLTEKEAESMYIQKRNQLNPKAGSGQPSREPVRPGTSNPQLYCQTYPDGRTECK
jgi:hypothetical protein